MKVLVDTSVWVDHFKQRNAELIHLLEGGRVQCHPYVVIEVACGTPPNRGDVIRLLDQLDKTPTATANELLHFIDHHALYARGCGLVDIALLASARIDGRCLVWTHDKRLASVADSMGLAFKHNPT